METNELRNLRYEIIGLRQDLSKLANLLAAPQPTEEPLVEKKVESLESKVSDILLSYRIPVHVKGFKYLKEAILMELEGNGLKYGITKSIYPEIARKHKDTSSKVERAMRHAVETGWSKRGKEPYMKPTNSEFIALISEKIRVESEEVA